jgi:hypothetical protein
MSVSVPSVPLAFSEKLEEFPLVQKLDRVVGREARDLAPEDFRIGKVERAATGGEVEPIPPARLPDGIVCSA